MDVRLPPAIHPGDAVGVAALSGVVDPVRLEAGLAALTRLGYRPVEAANLRRRSGLFAGTDTERLDAFHELVANPEVRAIVFARGGHGVLRLLPRLDWDLLGQMPRAYVGYSDLTPFLQLVVQRLGWVAFHGPMVAADLARGLEVEEARSLVAALSGRPDEHLPLVDTLGAGEGSGGEVAASGPLLGGCLSLLAATQGTPFAPALDGAWLFVEEIDEPQYRLDRMLTHLWLSGTLQGIHGMVFGHLATTSARRGAARWQPLFADLQARGIPTLAWGLPAGHRAPNRTIPLGLPVRLQPRPPRLVFETRRVSEQEA